MNQDQKNVVAIIDDDPLSLLINQFVVEVAGYETATFPGAVRFLQWLHGQEPVCVLLDLYMPTVDGFELLRRLRKHRDVPVIVISANLDPANVRALLAAGASDCVCKPVELEDLQARLASVTHTMSMAA